MSHYPVVSTHKNCAVRQVMGAKQAIGLRYDSFSLSRRARHRSASSSAARLSRATPKLNSIWATRTRARRARPPGSVGGRFPLDQPSARGTAVRGKYAHNRKCTCPSCMTVNDATLVHVGEVRTFGATASQRGAPILSSLCGHFQPQLKVTKMSFPSQMLILVSSVCYMLTRKSDAEKALTVLIKFHALHCALMRDICTEQGDEFRGSNGTFSHSDGNGTLQTKDSLDFLLKRVIEDEMLKHILMLAHRLKLHGLAERWKMTVMKRQIPCCSVPVDHISFGRQQLHMPIFFATAAHERPQPSHAHELFDHQQPRVDQLCVFGSDCHELLPTHQKVPGQQARKRLIYYGESTERHLSKTLRASASTRSSHATPGAISSAKVCTRNCPLQADNFTGMSQPLAMRNVFSPNVSSPSQVLESGGAGGEIGMKEGISHMPKSTVNGDGCSSSSEANRQPRNERSPPTASASHRPLQNDGRRTQDQKRKASDTTRMDTSSNLNTRANSAPIRTSPTGL